MTFDRATQASGDWRKEEAAARLSFGDFVDEEPPLPSAYSPTLPFFAIVGSLGLVVALYFSF